MVQDAEVKVRLKAEGAEETKQRLLETRAALMGVSSGQLENAQAQRQAARDAQVLNNAEAYKTRIYLAQHPALNSLTRSMRDFGSVSRGILSITTAFSTAISALNSTSSGLADVNAELDQAKREQAFALKTYGFDSREYADATDKVNEFTAKQKELNGQKSQENISGWLNFGAAIGILGQSAVTTIPRIAAMIPIMSAASIAIGGATIALGPLVLIAAGVALAAILIVTYWKEITDFFSNTLLPAFKQVGSFIQNNFITPILGAFGVFANVLAGVWTGVRGGFIGFWNGMVTIANSAIGGILKGVEGLANGFVSVINAIVAGYNRLAGILRLPTLGQIGNVSIPFSPIPTIAAANGFDGTVNSPTMFLAGEAGAEHVSISPSGKGGRTVVMNNYFHFEGSLRSSQDFKKDVDNALKESLKRHGWN